MAAFPHGETFDSRPISFEPSFGAPVRTVDKLLEAMCTLSITGGFQRAKEMERYLRPTVWILLTRSFMLKMRHTTHSSILALYYQQSFSPCSRLSKCHQGHPHYTEELQSKNQCFVRNIHMKEMTFSDIDKVKASMLPGFYLDTCHLRVWWIVTISGERIKTKVFVRYSYWFLVNVLVLVSIWFASLEYLNSL